MIDPTNLRPIIFIITGLNPKQLILFNFISNLFYTYFPISVLFHLSAVLSRSLKQPSFLHNLQQIDAAIIEIWANIHRNTLYMAKIEFVHSNNLESQYLV